MAEGDPISLPPPEAGDCDGDSDLSAGHDTDKKQEKVTIFLKATASAPILKTKKWIVEPDRTISSINLFVKKYIKLEPTDSLFLYVNQSFAPSPDQTMKNLYECFGTDGKLVLHYCTSPAWG